MCATPKAQGSVTDDEGEVAWDAERASELRYGRLLGRCGARATTSTMCVSARGAGNVLSRWWA
jgi:hypothetical protein